MCDPERKTVYRNIWSCVEKHYNTGWMVSERGFQAALYTELKKKLPCTADVVVEPSWKIPDGTRRIHDLVIVENDQITDIFELKFVPHCWAAWKNDLEKLKSYVRKPKAKYSVRLNPNTGKWAECIPVKADCRCHFVVVSQHDAEAIDPCCVTKDYPKVNHWYGRIKDGDNKWDIKFAKGE